MRTCLDVCCPVPIALVSPLSSDVPLRTAAFGLEDRWLLWSRARLYADRMELTGWGLQPKGGGAKGDVGRQG